MEDTNAKWLWITRKNEIFLQLHGKFETIGSSGKIQLVCKAGRWEVSFFSDKNRDYIKKYEIHSGSLQEKLAEVEILSKAIGFTPWAVYDVESIDRIPFGWQITEDSKEAE